MSAPPRVLAIGALDARGIVGTSGLRVSWSDLGVEPPGNGRTFRALFGVSDPTFRRLDALSKILVFATEAAGLPNVLPDEERESTAMVLATERAALDADLRFAGGLAAGFAEGALFPYTLATACLGEIAQRQQLRGTTLCLSIGAGQEAEALRESRRLLEDGEARYVLCGIGEALTEDRADLRATCRAVVVLLAAPELGGDAVMPWPSEERMSLSAMAEQAWAVAPS